MTRIACPFCGPRELSEFTFHKTLPGAGSPCARVYERVDDRARSVEHWQHGGGCRGWLTVERNPSTGEVLQVLLLGTADPSAAA